MAQSMERPSRFFRANLNEVPKVTDGETWPHFTRRRLDDGLRRRKLIFFSDCTKSNCEMGLAGMILRCGTMSLYFASETCSQSKIEEVWKTSKVRNDSQSSIPRAIDSSPGILSTNLKNKLDSRKIRVYFPSVARSLPVIGGARGPSIDGFWQRFATLINPAIIAKRPSRSVTDCSARKGGDDLIPSVRIDEIILPTF